MHQRRVCAAEDRCVEHAHWSSDDFHEMRRKALRMRQNTLCVLLRMVPLLGALCPVVVPILSESHDFRLAYLVSLKVTRTALVLALETAK